MAGQVLGVVAMLVARASSKVSLYLSSDQTEALYGIKTDGLYYMREGVVNKYAMNFQHQVIPAGVDHIDFTWRARPGSSVPYKLTFIHTPGPAMAAPSVNISQTGLVPTYPDKFRLHFPCTGRVAAQVETLLQVSYNCYNLSISCSEIESHLPPDHARHQAREAGGSELQAAEGVQAVGSAAGGAGGGACRPP